MKRTTLADRQLPGYTRGEEICNMVTHIVGGAMGIAACALCPIVGALHRNGYTWARSATDGEAGTTDGITDAEWQRVMAEAFNRGNGGCDHGNH